MCEKLARQEHRGPKSQDDLCVREITPQGVEFDLAVRDSKRVALWERLVRDRAWEKSYHHRIPKLALEQSREENEP